MGNFFTKKIFWVLWQFFFLKIKMRQKNQFFGHKTCGPSSMRLKLRYVHTIGVRKRFLKKNWWHLNPVKSYEKRPPQPLKWPPQPL